MAIEKFAAKKLLTQIDTMFNAELVGLPIPIPKGALDWAKEKILGEALGDIRRLVEESRPPVFYLLGRAQHGKSSLINALAGKDVAKIGGVGKPVTPQLTKYPISFPDRHSEWVVYDSRGIFESVRPDGAKDKDAVETAKEEIRSLKPDIIFHVIAITEVANLHHDVQVMKELQSGMTTPVIVVLTKADNLNKVSEWPPEKYPAKTKAIADHVASMAKYGAGGQNSFPIVIGDPFRGCQIGGDSHFLYVIPVNVPQDPTDRWNVDLLMDIIGKNLPGSARLEFFQAVNRTQLLQEMSSGLITKFSSIAGTIGLSPIPIADIVILTPLQMLLVAIIGGLSCRPVSKETAGEYFAAAGITSGVGWVLRTLAQQLVKLIPVPGAGAALSGAIAAGGTYTIGKSAETYFFSGEFRKPEEFKKEGDEFAKAHNIK